MKKAVTRGRRTTEGLMESKELGSNDSPGKVDLDALFGPDCFLQEIPESNDGDNPECLKANLERKIQNQITIISSLGGLYEDVVFTTEKFRSRNRIFHEGSNSSNWSGSASTVTSSDMALMSLSGTSIFDDKYQRLSKMTCQKGVTAKGWRISFMMPRKPSDKL